MHAINYLKDLNIMPNMLRFRRSRLNYPPLQMQRNHGICPLEMSKKMDIVQIKRIKSESQMLNVSRGV